MTNKFAKLNMFIKKESNWTFLLEKENESILLFPFWRYFEFLHHSMFSNMDDMLNGLSNYTSRLMLASNMSFVLLDLIKRPLVWEFNLSKKNHVNLTLKVFLKNISDETQLTILFNKYPVLKMLFETIIDHYHEYMKNLIDRLKIDFAYLSKIFKLNDFKLYSFLIKGDSHYLGNRVTEITFKNPLNKVVKKIIYKPRDLRLEKFFNDFIQHLKTKEESFLLKTVVVIPRDQYGWMEYINQETVDSSGANKYYYNFGVLLGICSIFNGQDLHFENIIASGENPIIIDLECLFSSPTTERQYIDPYFPSLFDTLLIPFESKINDTMYDFSAVLNHSKQESFMHRFEVKGNFVSTVYIERSIVNITPITNVLINKSNGTPFSASNYRTILADGYTDYLNWVITNKDDLIDFTTKNFFNLKNRVLFRPTFIYSKIMLESYHPRLLSDRKKYDEYLSQLYDKDNEIYKCIYQDEVFDLLNGDIPYFSTTTNERCCKNSQGVKINYVSYCSGIDRAINKIHLLDENYVSKTTNQILASLKDRYV